MNEFALGMLAMANPSWALQYDRSMKAALERRIENGDVTIWDEDKTKFNPFLILDGMKYNMVSSKYAAFKSKTTTSAKLDDPNLVWSPRKRFAYANRVLPRLSRLETAQGNRRGSVCFDQDVIIPTLYEKTNDFCLKVWMSMTPMEVFTQRKAIRMATGTVLIGGLGLGWLLKKVAAKRSVKRIIVVEKERELLEWYGYEMVDRVRHGHTPKHVDLIHGDVWDHIGIYGDDVRHLVDIWMSFPSGIYDVPPKARETVCKLKHFWGWGFSS